MTVFHTRILFFNAFFIGKKKLQIGPKDPYQPSLTLADFFVNTVNSSHEPQGRGEEHNWASSKEAGARNTNLTCQENVTKELISKNINKKHQAQKEKCHFWSLGTHHPSFAKQVVFNHIEKPHRSECIFLSPTQLHLSLTSINICISIVVPTCHHREHSVLQEVIINFYSELLEIKSQ